MKKIFKVILIISIFALLSGVASAQTAVTNGPATAPIKYTAAQQTCLKTAQTARAVAAKAATDALSAAIIDASNVKQNAFAAAQKITDVKARVAAMKTANDTYNNDATVKQARVPYAAAIKAANEQFQVSSRSCLLGEVGFLQEILKNMAASLSDSSLRTQPKQTPIKYTSDQQTCIRTAQDARQAATKTSTDALNTATKDALTIKQQAMKAAQDALNAATKVAQKARQDAITAAAKITDPNTKTAAMKAAQDAYNKNVAVKTAQAIYQAAIKAANNTYNNDATVVAAKVPFNATMKAANDKFQSDLKACSVGNGIGATKNFFGNFFHRLINFFSRKK